MKFKRLALMAAMPAIAAAEGYNAVITLKDGLKYAGILDLALTVCLVIGGYYLWNHWDYGRKFPEISVEVNEVE